MMPSQIQMPHHEMKLGLHQQHEIHISQQPLPAHEHYINVSQPSHLAPLHLTRHISTT